MSIFFNVSKIKCLSQEKDINAIVEEKLTLEQNILIVRNLENVNVEIL